MTVLIILGALALSFLSALMVFARSPSLRYYMAQEWDNKNDLSYGTAVVMALLWPLLAVLIFGEGIVLGFKKYFWVGQDDPQIKNSPEPKKLYR